MENIEVVTVESSTHRSLQTKIKEAIDKFSRDHTFQDIRISTSNQAEGFFVAQRHYATLTFIGVVPK